MRFVQMTSSGVYVLGVAHSSIQVGDRFHRVKWFPPREVPDAHSGQSLARVRLKVVSMTAFHNVINRAHAAMNVGIEFEGDGLPLLNALDEQGWCYDQGQYHQWAERVDAMPKLVLTR